MRYTVVIVRVDPANGKRLDPPSVKVMHGNVQIAKMLGNNETRMRDNARQIIVALNAAEVSA